MCRALTIFLAVTLLAFPAFLATEGARAQEEDLAPAVRYDVLKHKLNQAILAKKPKETIEIISQLRKTPLGVKGEMLFYEAHAHYQLKDWKPAYRALVAYLNSMGRKGRNYKAGIGLYVKIESEIKKEYRTAKNVGRADKSWSIASAAYDRLSRQRNAWKEKIVTFGGPKNDMAWVMARRANGGFLVGGTFEHKGDEKKKIKAGRSMGIMALSRDGRMAWNRVVIGTAKDGSVRYLKALPKGGFLLGGVHRGFQVAARIDANAVTVNNYDGKPWINAFARSKDGAGGIVALGGKGGFIALGAEIAAKDGKGPRLPFAVRISNDGKTLGKTVYTGNAARYWHDIADATELPGGDVVAVGETRPVAAWDTRPGMGYLLRIKPEGKVVWARRVPARGAGSVRFSAVAPAANGGVIAAGRQGEKLLVLKAGADGKEQWRKSIAYRELMPAAARALCNVPQLASLVKKSYSEKNQPSPDAGLIAAVRNMTCKSGTPFVSATAISARKDGYLVLAFQGRGSHDKTDIRLIAIDKSGNILWDRVYGHDGFDIATSALATEDSGAIIAGATDSIGTGGRDFLMFKIDRNGLFAPWTKLGPPVAPKPKPKKTTSVKPEPAEKSSEKPEAKPETKPEAKPEVTPEPVAKRESGGESKASRRKVTESKAAKTTPPIKTPKKKETKDTGSGDSAATAQSGGEPPETSFGEIFDSIFGGGDSDKSDTEDKKSATPEPEAAP